MRKRDYKRIQEVQSSTKKSVENSTSIIDKKEPTETEIRRIKPAKGGKIVGFESQSKKNRGRAEKK